MRAVGEAGQRRRVDLVAALLQNVDDLPPAPTAMIGAVNEHEGLAPAGLRQRVAAAERRRADTERRTAKRRASRDRADIRHEILPGSRSRSPDRRVDYTGIPRISAGSSVHDPTGT